MASLPAERALPRRALRSDVSALRFSWVGSGGVQEAGQQFDPVDEPRPRAHDVAVGVDGVQSAGLDGGEVGEIGPARDLCKLFAGRYFVEATGRDDEHLGL